MCASFNNLSFTFFTICSNIKSEIKDQNDSSLCLCNGIMYTVHVKGYNSSSVLWKMSLKSHRTFICNKMQNGQIFVINHPIFCTFVISVKVDTLQ